MFFKKSIFLTIKDTTYPCSTRFKNIILDRVKQKNPLMDEKAIEKAGQEIDSILSKIKGVSKDNGYSSIKALKANDLWDLAQELDDRTRIYERSSDPNYETAAQVLNEFTSSIRGVLGERVNQISPEISSLIKPNADLYGKAVVARKAFADSVRRGVLQNKAIAGQGFVNKMIDQTIGSTPVRGSYTGLLDLAAKTSKIPAKGATPLSKGLTVLGSKEK